MEGEDPPGTEESEGTQMEPQPPPVPRRRRSSLSQSRLSDLSGKAEGLDPTFVSMRSDRSVGRIIDFRGKPKVLDPTITSMKSDRSVGRIIDFREKANTLDPTIVSMKSDRSVGRIIDFRENTKRPDPTLVSMKSDWSERRLIDFRKEVPELPCAAIKSDHSISKIDLRVRPSDPFGSRPNILDSTFQQLEELVLTFVRQQLQRFHRALAFDYPESLASEEDDEQSSREAVLKITLDFLHRMKQEDLAEQLRKRSHAGVCGEKMKRCLQQKFNHGFEDSSKGGLSAPLEQIYTELHIMKGGASEVMQEHEVRHIEAASRRPATAETIVTCEELFKTRPSTGEPIRAGLMKSMTTSNLTRTVLTKGVAGVGKTVLTQKFCLDWAKRRANQDIDLLVPFTFRQLNVFKDTMFSLVGLLHHCFPQIKGFSSFDDLQVLFIFDGLDECRLLLDFRSTRVLIEPTESATVEELLVNLIRGDLLPSARIWITTRPAAANQIPVQCVSIVTEVRGFTDSQKDQYFMKTFREDATVAISHIKRSQSLYIMCHLPIFCWILSKALLYLNKIKDRGNLPQTLTQMYIHFLVVQAKVKNMKYEGTGAERLWTPETREMIRSLGKLAFEQLMKGNLIFYGSDLRECGLDAAEIARYSGVFTEIFREEPGLIQYKVYCFIHLTVQEFLAAFHIHQTFFSSGENLLSLQYSSDVKTATVEQPTTSVGKSKTKRHMFVRKNSDLQIIKPAPVTEDKTSATDLYRSAIDLALQSPNGHLDLCLRFLLGLSLPANQNLLQGLLIQTGSDSTNQETVQFIKEKLSEGLPTEKSLNLFHCLNELNDHALLDTVQRSLTDGTLTDYEVNESDWSAVAFLLLTSNSDLEEFDLRKYCPCESVLLKLMPVVKVATKVILSGCGLTSLSCAPRASLARVLHSSTMTHLDLSNNDLQDLGVELLCEGLKRVDFRLESLSLSRCGLSHHSCAPLASILSFSSLKLLDLSNNDLWNSGVEQLCEGLKSATCRLQTLRLSGCLVSERGGTSLAVTLSSSSSRIRELDLSYNHPGASAERLCALKDQPHCPLDSLRLDPAGQQWMVPGLRKYSCALSLDPRSADRRLRLSDSARRVTRDSLKQSSRHSQNIDGVPQVHCSSALRGRCYFEVDWEVDRKEGWSGAVEISLSYRKHKEEHDPSWSLLCSRGSYSVRHEHRRTLLSVSPGCSGRVAVFLDHDAGALSFYEVNSEGQLCHLHSFSCSFTAALVLGFGLGTGSSVSLVDTGTSLDHGCKLESRPPVPPRSYTVESKPGEGQKGSRLRK